MELFQLRYFVAAARLGNFRRAAEAVCISQPSLSLQIANLEREVGVALFVRVGRGVQLTDAGQVLCDHAERLLDAEAGARAAVRAVAGLEAGHLAIWTLPTPGQTLLPPLLADFRAAHPGVALTVHEAVPARAIGEAVAGGRADIGFVHLPCAVAGLTVRPLFTEELALVVPHNHPLAAPNAAPPALADLAAEDWVWVPEGTTSEHPIYAACLSAGFAPRIACVSGSAQGMQGFVAAGLGIALLPRLALSHPPPGVAVVELAPPRPTRTLAVIWRGEHAHLSHAARTFAERVVAALSDTDPSV